MPKARIAVGALAVMTWGMVVLSGGTTHAAERILAGLVRDSIGNVMQDVEVFVLPEKGTLPVASVRSGPDGRYLISDLPPGIYRIAGIKPGYIAFLGRVNTLFHSSLDLLLRPAPAPGEAGSELDPGNATWALRLPERSVLRDLGARAEGQGGALAAGPAFHDILQGQVDQLFALGNLVSGSSSEAGVQGMETRLRLAGSLGERGNVKLRGRRESLGAARGDTDGGASTERKTADVLVNLTYDPTYDSNVSVKSYYARQDLLAADSIAPSSPRRQSARSWGCDARWSKQLDPGSRVDVGFHYADSLLDLPDPSGAGVAPAPGVAGEKGISNRAVGAGGNFESVTGGGHQLNLGFQARLLDLAHPRWQTTAEDAYRAAVGLAGWNLRLNAQDAWSVSSRASILYGLGYYQPLDVQGRTSMVIPRLGGVWAAEHLRLRVLLSYYGTTSGGDALPANDLLLRGVSPIGYDAEAQVPLSPGFVVRGTLSFTPAEYDGAAASPGEASVVQRPVYVTNGNAASRETTLALERTVGGIITFLQYTRGSAEGSLSVIPLFHGPLGILSDGQIEFRTGRVGVRIAPSGTELAAEYRRILETGLADADVAASESERRYVELRLAQDVMRLQGNGSYWRFLLVARQASGDSERASIGSSTTDWAAVGREVSAGISVAF